MCVILGFSAGLTVSGLLQLGVPSSGVVLSVYDRRGCSRKKKEKTPVVLLYISRCSSSNSFCYGSSFCYVLPPAFLFMVSPLGFSSLSFVLSVWASWSSLVRLLLGGSSLSLSLM